MALDTNIALGIRPVEQPNMLAQMGQMMQMRQMQQGFESENALRDFYAQGGDINKAEDRQRLLSRAPLQGQKILGLESERRARDVGTLGKEYENARVGLTNVNDEAGYYNWVQSSFNNPAIAAHLNQMGITPERALANARATVAKEGLSTAINKSAMGISEFIKQDLGLKNATQNAQISAGPGNRQADLAREKYEDQLKYGGDVVTTTIPNPENPKERIEIQTRRNIRGGELIPLEVQSPPMRVDISPSSATSAYQPSGGGGRPNVLATQVAPQGGAQPQAPAGTTFAMPKSKSENLTEYQGKSTAFAIRAKQAHEILNVVGNDGKVQPGLIKRGAEAIPFIGEGLGTALNITQSDAQQQVEQAQRNFVNAVLRQESGAAINESEFNNAKKQYFPQPGDSAAVIEQKRLNREAAIQGFEVSAGPGAKKTTPPSAGPARIGSDSEYNALPSGATFTAPDGTIRRKP